MARRFVRVDLSSSARDFRPLAVEPGLPLLDRVGANTKLLCRWLGRMVAEPEWEGEAVNFFVRDEAGGRLEECVCYPSSRADINECLLDEVHALRERLGRVHPETVTERAIHRYLTRLLADLLDDPHRTDLDDYFFRFRDVQDRWRLVWCWGYQRADQEAAPAVVCTAPDCNLLFVRRPSGSQKCPSCAAGLTGRKRRSMTIPLLVGLAALLLLGVAGYFAVTWRTLVVSPWVWNAKAGSRFEFQVIEKGLFRKRDVSSLVSGVTNDTRIVRLDRYGPGAVATGPGQTTVNFYFGSASAKVDVTIAAAKVPTKLSIEPHSVELGVGSTARLRLIGEYDDNTKADLTEVAQWTAQNDGIAFLWNGFVEGMGEGATSITAHYRPDPQAAPVEATATVSVAKTEYKSLDVSVQPLPIGQNRGSPLAIDALTTDGKRYSVLGSSLLSASIDPPELATFFGNNVVGQKLGKGRVRATLNGQLNAEREFQVVEVPPVSALVVRPQELNLVVDEVADLSIATPTADPVKITISDMATVEITPDGRLVGRQAGQAQVEVVQGEHKATVTVKVAAATFQAIAIDPLRVGVPVDDIAAVRVLGQTDTGRQAEIARDRLMAVKTPSPRFAEYDPQRLAVRGIQPTDAKSAQSLELSYDRFLAAAPVDVVLPPLRLEIAPTGMLEVPLGQQAAIRASAIYHGTHRADVPGDRVQWHTDPPLGTVPLVTPAKTGQSATATSPAAPSAPGGLEIRNGHIAALKPNLGPVTLWGTYFGRESNRIQVKSVDAAAVALKLEADPDKLGIGEAGSTRLTGTVGDQPVDLIPDLAEFSTSNQQAVTVDAHSGAYRAAGSGAATLAAKHPAAKEPGTVTINVTEPPKPPRDAPVAVRILSDQGQAVRFAVGAEFDDFRVEAEYPDGVTRLVTKKATLRTAETAEKSPVSPTNGHLNGVRPGATVVQAEFDGVASKQGLQVTVRGDLDVDELRLAPAPATILPKETFTMDVEGFKNGKSVGLLTGIGKLLWKSSDDAVVQANGSVITGQKLGQANVTAQLGNITSKPAQVSVVDSILTPLKVDPKRLQLRVGESREIGVDLTVTRGDMDLSRQCSVTSSLPGIVRYSLETHSLVGVSPGVAPVTFAWGDKLATTEVEVVSAGTIRGKVQIEPSAVTLAPGQSQDLRVYVVDADGRRYDRTDSAVLVTKDPSRVTTNGSRIQAVKPGAAEVMATVSGADGAATTFVTVSDLKINEMLVDPAGLSLSVGDRAELRILGRSDAGTHELFAQPGLTAKVGGANPEAIRLSGTNTIEAVAPGTAEITLTWDNRLTRSVPVTVSADRLADLQITPNVASVEPGDNVVYSVTGQRGGRRRVLTAEDGLTLSVTQPDVAQASGASVRGVAPGHTTVVAQAGGQQAEASLTVAPQGTLVRDLPSTTAVGADDTYIEYIDGRPVRRHRHHGHRRVTVLPDGRVVETDEVVSAPAAAVKDLQFVPDTLRLPLGSPGAGVKVMEVLTDGTLGRDVTNDPALEISQPESGVASLEKTPSGPRFKPLKNGQTRVAARMGNATTVGPLWLQVGDVAAGTARLDVAPDRLSLWTGESAPLSGVQVVPGPGQTPFDVSYRLQPQREGVVAVEGDRRLRGLSVGSVPVTVTAVQPGGPYDGLAATVQVDVANPERLMIDPAELSLQVGQQTPRFTVLADGNGSGTHEVPAVVESVDPNILAPDPDAPGRFIARQYGGTQVRGSYRGREAFATITITGKCFSMVNTSLNEGDNDFDVTIDVQAAQSEGPLEYRVYAAGQDPPATWQPADLAGDTRHVVLHSPRMPYRGPAAQYRLIIEARHPDTKVTQNYPLTFRLVPKLERTDSGKR